MFGKPVPFGLGWPADFFGGLVWIVWQHDFVAGIVFQWFLLESLILAQDERWRRA